MEFNSDEINNDFLKYEIVCCRSTILCSISVHYPKLLQLGTLFILLHLMLFSPFVLKHHEKSKSILDSVNVFLKVCKITSDTAIDTTSERPGWRSRHSPKLNQLIC